jgi:hypothetical protein
MNSRNRATAAVSAVVVALALTFGAGSTHAASRCDGPTIGGDARACAAEREGPEALRRFVTRTRMIYGLYFWDLRHDEDAAMAQSSQTLVAQQDTRAP